MTEDKIGRSAAMQWTTTTDDNCSDIGRGKSSTSFIANSVSTARSMSLHGHTHTHTHTHSSYDRQSLSQMLSSCTFSRHFPLKDLIIISNVWLVLGTGLGLVCFAMEARVTSLREDRGGCAVWRGNDRHIVT